MKISQLIIKSLVITSIIISMPTHANEVTADTSKKISTSEECGADFLPLPKPAKSGEVSYISGGICITGVQQMKDLAKDYPLEVVLVEQASQNEKENYIADVKVTIKDAKDNLVLDIYTKGPFLLVSLPDGSYQITAEYNRIVQTKIVKVHSEKHYRTVFVWQSESKNQNE